MQAGWHHKLPSCQHQPGVSGNSCQARRLYQIHSRTSTFYEGGIELSVQDNKTSNLLIFSSVVLPRDLPPLPWAIASPCPMVARARWQSDLTRDQEQGHLYLPPSDLSQGQSSSLWRLVDRGAMFYMREISNFSTSLKIENLNEIFKLKYIFKITIQSILVHCHSPFHFDNHVRMRPAQTAGPAVQGCTKPRRRFE